MLDADNSGMTISLELSAEEVAALARTIPVTAPPVSVERAFNQSSSRRLKAIRRSTVLIGIAGAIMLVAAIGYFARASTPASAPSRHTSVALALPVPTPEPPPPESAPVRFANPFDKTEVFEFPAGTGKRAAHDAVAEILLKRAEERLHTPKPVAAN